MMPPPAKAKPVKAGNDDTPEADAEKLLADARAEAEQVKAEAESDAEATRANAAQVLADAQEQAAGVLAGARDAVGVASLDSDETDEYRVVIPGASYKLPGVEHSRRFALKGEIITIDASEAERLRELGAIVGKDAPDPVVPGLPEGDNPAGGKELESKEEHAAKLETSRAPEGK